MGLGIKVKGLFSGLFPYHEVDGLRGNGLLLIVVTEGKH